MDISTQTDAYMDCPSIPLFIPQKNGIDCGTQIENNDLFNFDLEIEPILEVLIGKTLEISLMEILEENELKKLNEHQNIFEQNKNYELSEIQRLESNAIRLENEKKRRINEEIEYYKKKEIIEEKVAARSYAKNYLSNLHSNVFSTLLSNGYFYDPLNYEIKNKFIPYLITNATNNIKNINEINKLTDNIIMKIL